ncbi:unnamed protein product [Dracunculus medinensis]|uniref:Homeobox domain-containing protein n=1 Tax=Dracunculus medinensis TaxID=318479 RepID=A0A158Q580_DRAME|nr:unnamed protein product [Dracunculus medinensis]
MQRSLATQREKTLWTNSGIYSSIAKFNEASISSASFSAFISSNFEAIAKPEATTTHISKSQQRPHKNHHTTVQRKSEKKNKEPDYITAFSKELNRAKANYNERFPFSELPLGYLHYALTNVPPQSNPLPGSVEHDYL